MSEARRRILQMLAEGKITVDQSEELLSAVEQDQQASRQTEGSEKIRVNVKKVAADVKTQVAEAIKKVEPHTKEIKSKLKELGGWIQGTVNSMMDDFSFPRFGPPDGLEVDFQVPQPEGLDGCESCEINVPHGSVSIRLGEKFQLMVRGKISKAALEGYPPLDWFRGHLIKYDSGKFFLGFDKAAAYKAVLHLDLVLPREMPLQLSSVSANLVVKGNFPVRGISVVSGDVVLTEVVVNGGSIDSVSGDVKLEEGRFSGQAKTTSGDFALQRCQLGEVSLASVSGDILLDCCRVQPETRVVLATTSGDIKVRKTEGDLGEITASTRTGDIQQELNDTLQEKPQELRLRLGDHGASLRAETVSGDISFS